VSTDSFKKNGWRLAAKRQYRMPLLIMVACIACGCRPAPQVPSANLVYSAALRTAANTRNLDRLRTAEQRIDNDHVAGLIAAEEYTFYGRIIASAEAGHWEKAEQAALQFRHDQLR
jgi:hypothetical protein